MRKLCARSQKSTVKIDFVYGSSVFKDKGVREALGIVIFATRFAFQNSLVFNGLGGGTEVIQER
jgi:hypothetical protein